MVPWILFSRILNFFHKICCLFWNPQNCFFVWETKCAIKFQSNHLNFLSSPSACGQNWSAQHGPHFPMLIFLSKKPKKFLKETITNRQFSIRENKIREIISWADHMNNLKGLNITTHPCTVQIWTGTVGRFYQCQLFKNSIGEQQSQYIEETQGAYLFWAKKGVSSKPSGVHIVAPILCFYS